MTRRSVESEVDRGTSARNLTGSRPSTLLVVGILILFGCVNLGKSGGAEGDSVGEVLTREEITRSGASNLWDVLRLCRTLQLSLDREGNPVAISHRGRNSILLSDTPLIFVDGTRVLDLATLPLISADDIASVRILSASEASTRYGLGAHNGVVEVQTIHD